MGLALVSGEQPTYEAIRQAILDRREQERPYREYGERNGKSKRAINTTINRRLDRPGRRSNPPDPREGLPEPPSAAITKIEGVLAHGMQLADQAGTLALKAQVVAASTNLRRELVRARAMRRRLEATALPERMDGDDGLRWIVGQLAEIAMDAHHCSDVTGALAAIKTLAGLVGHGGEEPGEGRGDVNFNLVQMIQRLDAEEQQPKLIEAERSDDA